MDLVQQVNEIGGPILSRIGNTFIEYFSPSEKDNLSKLCIAYKCGNYEKIT